MTVEVHREELYIPASRRALCAGCGEPVDTASRSTFQRATGWIQNRGNHLVLSERSPAWMCRPCVDRLKAGVGIGQGALFETRSTDD